jgi:tRNA threonylcarbamoyladenosine biosynthesis protein TsaB
MEVYTTLFDASGNRVQATTAQIIDEHSFADVLDRHRIVFFGDGAAKCEEVLGQHSHAVFVTDFVNSAIHLTRLAQEKFDNQVFEDVAYFEPFYLKDFIAGKKANLNLNG